VASEPAGSTDARPQEFGPLSFSSDGKMENEFYGEVRPSRTDANNFGDHLSLAFVSLTEGPQATPITVESVSTKPCDCFEYAKQVIGPEELKDPRYQMKVYPPEEGQAAMLKDRPVSADK
jgi:hypothetical protein